MVLYLSWPLACKYITMLSLKFPWPSLFSAISFWGLVHLGNWVMVSGGKCTLVHYPTLDHYCIALLHLNHKNRYINIIGHGQPPVRTNVRCLLLYWSVANICECFCLKLCHRFKIRGSCCTFQNAWNVQVLSSVWLGLAIMTHHICKEMMPVNVTKHLNRMQSY